MVLSLPEARKAMALWSLPLARKAMASAVFIRPVPRWLLTLLAEELTMRTAVVRKKAAAVSLFSVEKVMVKRGGCFVCLSVSTEATVYLRAVLNI